MHQHGHGTRTPTQDMEFEKIVDTDMAGDMPHVYLLFIYLTQYFELIFSPKRTKNLQIHPYHVPIRVPDMSPAMSPVKFNLNFGTSLVACPCMSPHVRTPRYVDL